MRKPYLDPWRQLARRLDQKLWVHPVGTGRFLEPHERLFLWLWRVFKAERDPAGGAENNLYRKKCLEFLARVSSEAEELSEVLLEILYDQACPDGAIDQETREAKDQDGRYADCFIQAAETLNLKITVEPDLIQGKPGTMEKGMAGVPMTRESISRIIKDLREQKKWAGSLWLGYYSLFRDKAPAGHSPYRKYAQAIDTHSTRTANSCRDNLYTLITKLQEDYGWNGDRLVKLASGLEAPAGVDRLQGTRASEWLYLRFMQLAKSENPSTGDKKKLDFYISKLIDFRIGPSTFLAGARDSRVGSPRESKLFGLRPQVQDVFLVAPRVQPLYKSNKEDRLGMDDFARAVADDELEHGVHLLTGIRGSGKSTVINRIEWFCNHWKPERQRPFMLRFDLGCAYDHKIFLVSLMNALCREVRAHTRRPPLGSFMNIWDFPRFRDFIGMIGRIGRWCAANSRWAWVMGFIGIAAMAVQWVGELPRRHVDEWNKAVASLDAVGTQIENQADNLASPNPLKNAAVDSSVWRTMAETGETLETNAPRFLPPVGELLRSSPQLKMPLDTLQNRIFTLGANLAKDTNGILTPAIRNALGGSRELPGTVLAWTNFSTADSLSKLGLAIHDLGKIFEVLSKNDAFDKVAHPSAIGLLTNINSIGLQLHVIGVALESSNIVETIRDENFTNDFRQARFEVDEDDKLLRLRPRYEPLQPPKEKQEIAWPKVLCAIVFSILFIGWWHRLYQRICVSPPDEYRHAWFKWWSNVRHYPIRGRRAQYEWGPDLTLLISFIITAMIAAGLVRHSAANFQDEFASFQYWHPALLCLAGCWIFGTLTLAALQWVLPSWWHLKADCHAMELELLRLQENGKQEMPFFDSLTPLARLLLPLEVERPDLRELESSFLEQELKQLLHRIKSEFGQVAILIDDFDALPDNENENVSERKNFFRVLRPISKISGVVCVVAVPLSLYDEFRNGDPSDLHSTIHGMYVLGDRTLFDDHPNPPFPRKPFVFCYSGNFWLNEQEKTDAKEAVEKFISNLLTANLRIPATDVDSPPQFVKDLAKKWSKWAEPGADASEWHRIRKAFLKYEVSKREFLRELEKMLIDPNRKPFADQFPEFKFPQDPFFEL